MLKSQIRYLTRKSYVLPGGLNGGVRGCKEHPCNMYTCTRQVLRVPWGTGTVYTVIGTRGTFLLL